MPYYLTQYLIIFSAVSSDRNLKVFQFLRLSYHIRWSTSTSPACPVECGADTAWAHIRLSLIFSQELNLSSREKSIVLRETFAVFSRRFVYTKRCNLVSFPHTELGLYLSLSTTFLSLCSLHDIQLFFSSDQDEGSQPVHICMP